MTLQQICAEATHTRCACGASAGQPCPGGTVCLSRVARARASGLITFADLAAAIRAAAADGTLPGPGVTP